MECFIKSIVGRFYTKCFIQYQQRLLDGSDNGFSIIPGGCYLLIQANQFLVQNDEFFISESAAKDGVTIVNKSKSDPIVMLKHFGPGNPDLDIKYLSSN